MNPLAIIDKYYCDVPELKNILLEHSRDVANKALRITDAHPEFNADRDFVEEAALLHDIGIIFCDAPGILCYGEHMYIEHGWLGAELLRSEGFPRHASVAERHTGTGITLDEIVRNNWNIPVADYSPVTIEEQIICYSDKFFSKSHLGEERSFDKVRQQIWKYGSDAVQRLTDWHKMFE